MKEILNENKEKNIEWLIWKEKSDELARLLSFWEKYKEKWNEYKNIYRSKHNLNHFRNLLDKYNKYEKDFFKSWVKANIEWINTDEIKLIQSFDPLTRERFIEEYLVDDILYGLSYIYDIFQDIKEKKNEQTNKCKSRKKTRKTKIRLLQLLKKLFRVH